MPTPIRIGALVSGGGTNLQAIIEACAAGRINGQMAFVGSDVPDAGGLQRARRHAIPTFMVDYGAIIRRHRAAAQQVSLPPGVDLNELRAKQRLLKPDSDPQKITDFLISRVAAESCLLDQMAAYRVDLLVLAGFMRNLTPFFIDRFNLDPGHPRIMNIHPALLPAFPGVDGYGDTYRYGCKIGGCTVHFIDYGEDSGPIIGQRSFPILEEDSLETVKKKGLEQEWLLYPECIELFARQRLLVVKMTHVLPDGRLLQRKIVKIAAA